MRSFNKVMLLGNITADPVSKATKTGSGMANFSIATNRDWKDKEGKAITETHFHKVVAFGKLGEIISTYFKKGSPILLSGRLSTRSYAGKEGKVRSITEVVAEDFNFVPFNKGSRKTDLSEQSEQIANEKSDDSSLEASESELAEDLARKYSFNGAKLEEVVDY